MDSTIEEVHNEVESGADRETERIEIEDRDPVLCND